MCHSLHPGLSLDQLPPELLHFVFLRQLHFLLGVVEVPLFLLLGLCKSFTDPLSLVGALVGKRLVLASLGRLLLLGLLTFHLQLVDETLALDLRMALDWLNVLPVLFLATVDRGLGQGSNDYVLVCFPLFFPVLDFEVALVRSAHL